MVDPEGKVSDQLDSDILPTTLVFGADGTLLLRFIGPFHSTDHLEEYIEKALSRSEQPSE
jgi:hypothetical protein